MRRAGNRSGTELFLMEMILSVFFLVFSFTVCIGLFAGAASNRWEAQRLNHIRELSLSAGEVLEGCDGTAEAVLELLPGGIRKENTLVYYFDSEWNACGESDSAYSMSLKLLSSDEKKGAGISFSDRDGELLYDTEVYYPVFGKGALR